MDLNAAVKIAAQVTGMQAVDQLKKSLDETSHSVEGVTGKFGALMGSMKALAGAVGVIGFAGMMKSAIDAGAELANLSIKTGIAVETLSKYSTIAKLADTDMESVAGTLKKLSNSAVDAATGNQKLLNLFNSIGVSVRDANGNIKNADQLLKDIAFAVQGIDPEVVTKLMTELGGKNGANIVPFLRELTQRLDDTKVKFDEAFGKNAKEWNDNLVLIQGNIGALARSMVSDLLPALVRITGAIVDAKKAGEGLWGMVSAGISKTTEELYYPAKLDERKTKLEADIARIRKDMGEIENSSMYQRFGVGESDLKSYKGYLDDKVKLLAATEKAIEEAAKPLNPPTNAEATSKVEAALKQNNTSSGSDPFRSAMNEMGGEAAKLKWQSAHVQEYADKITNAKTAQMAFDTELGKFKDLSDAQKAQLMEAARMVDKYGQSLKLQMAALDYQNATDKINAETAAMGQNDLARKTMLAGLELEQKGIKKGTELYDQLIAKRVEALKTSSETQKSFGMGLQQGMTEYMEKISNTGQQIKEVMSNAFKGAEDALVNFVMTGKMSFASFANAILSDLARIAIRKAIIQPLVGAIGGLFSAAPAAASANGNVFSGGALQAFATGGIVNSPMVFPMANGGTGLMGEAGPEAIMPLKRDSSGRLGVSGGGSSTNINVVVNTDGSVNTKGDSNAGQNLGRAIAAAVKNEIMNQKRPGGLLAAGAIA